MGRSASRTQPVSPEHPLFAGTVFSTLKLSNVAGGRAGGRTGVTRALPDAGDEGRRQKMSTQPDSGVRVSPER